MAFRNCVSHCLQLSSGLHSSGQLGEESPNFHPTLSGPRPAVRRCDPFGVGGFFCVITPGAMRDPGLMALIPSGYD